MDGVMSVYEVIRRLPEVSVVRDRSRAMAMLDAILSPRRDFRYYSFDARWSPSEELASMRDGSGNEYSIVLSTAGAYARGFDHESPMSPFRDWPLAPWPGLFETVPDVFRPYVNEPAFSAADEDKTPLATVVFWREQSGTEWECGLVEIPADGIEDADGADRLFDVLVDGRAEAYRKFAVEYYEVELGLETIRHVYALRPLSPGIVAALNPDVSLADLAEDIAEIGYPVAG